MVCYAVSCHMDIILMAVRTHSAGENDITRFCVTIICYSSAFAFSGSITATAEIISSARIISTHIFLI